MLDLGNLTRDEADILQAIFLTARSEFIADREVGQIGSIERDWKRDRNQQLAEWIEQLEVRLRELALAEPVNDS